MSDLEAERLDLISRGWAATKADLARAQQALRDVEQALATVWFAQSGCGCGACEEQRAIMAMIRKGLEG